jgi:hypothetical protein
MEIFSMLLFNYRKRGIPGAALAEGVIGLAIVIGGLVLAIILMVNVGESLLIKNKLSLITSQAAQFAAGRPDQNPPVVETAAFVKDLMKQLGIGTGNPQTTVQSTTVNGEPGFKVTVVDNFPTFGKFFGPFFRLQDSAIAVQSKGQLPFDAVLVTGGMSDPQGTIPNGRALFLVGFEGTRPPSSLKGARTFRMQSFNVVKPSNPFPTVVVPQAPGKL